MPKNAQNAPALGRECLEIELLEGFSTGRSIIDPRRGDVIPDTNGVRKVRVALPGRGKRGGGRATYLYVETKDRVYFILAYAKNVKETTTPAEIKALASLARALKGE